MAYHLTLNSVLSAVDGDYTRARTSAKEGLLSPLNDKLGLVMGNLGLAIAGCDEGVFGEGIKSVLKAVEIGGGAKGKSAVAVWLLPVTACLLAGAGQSQCAVSLLGLAESHPLQVSGWLKDWALMAEVNSRPEQELGPDGYQAARKKGKGLKLEQVIVDLQEQFGD